MNNENINKLVTNTSNKRYAFMPLEESRRDVAVKGELLVDRSTGHLFVKDNYGIIKSATQDIEDKLNDIIDNSYFEQVDENYNTIRKAYRFYFDGNDKVRLDRDLKLPSGAYFFNIRDINDESKYYLPKASFVGADATYTGNLLNNTNYWVIFYNSVGEVLTQYLFNAKAAASVVSDLVPAHKLLSKIEIEVMRSIINVGDSWLDVCPRVYAYYHDHSRRDITNENGIILHKPDISTPGTKQIRASFYNMHDNRWAYANTNIEVREEFVSEINTLTVKPYVKMMKNGVKNIVLSIIAHFEDGRVQDITNKCVISNFDDEAFNKTQIITITTTYGRQSVFEMEYTINVHINDESHPNEENRRPVKLFFDNELVLPERSLNIINHPYYRVRRADDLDAYNTLQYIPTGYEGGYIGIMRSGDDHIIEFYNENKEIVLSYHAVAEFIKTIPKVSFIKSTEIFDDMHE